MNNVTDSLTHKMKEYTKEQYKTEFYLPSYKEQKSIVAHIEQETATIDTAISRAEREIDLMREYRDRLIADVITGKIDVRGIEVPEIAEDHLALDECSDSVDVDDAGGDDDADN